MTLEEIKKAILGLSDEDKSMLMESFEKETPPSEEQKPIEGEKPLEEKIEEQPKEQEQLEQHSDIEADKKMLEPVLKEIANIKAEIQAIKESVVKEKQNPQKAPDGEAEKLNKIAAKYSSD